MAAVAVASNVDSAARPVPYSACRTECCSGATPASRCGAVGTIDEIAHAALFFASSESGFIVGVTVSVDGGAVAAGLECVSDRSFVSAVVDSKCADLRQLCSGESCRVAFLQFLRRATAAGIG